MELLAIGAGRDRCDALEEATEEGRVFVAHFPADYINGLRRALKAALGLALGAQAGETRLAEVFREAGFSHFRRAGETPFNLIIEARR